MERPRLVAVNPVDRKTREFALPKSEVTVGSEKGNTLLLRDQSVSRRHAVIRHHGGRWTLRDLQSTNCTFVNDLRIRAAITLKDGDHVRFGAARFVFLDPAAAARVAKKRWLSPLRAIELLVILFGAGFGVTEYLLNRSVEVAAVPGIARRPVSRATVPAAAATAAMTIRPGAGAAPSVAASATPGSKPRSETSPPLEASSPEPDWLVRINFYRAMARLSPAREDSTLSDGDLKHTHYLMQNYGEIIRSLGTLGAAGHEEDPGKKGYTDEGAAAARNSNVAWGCGPFSAPGEIDRWMEGPFHRLAILNPDLDRAGFGEYETGPCWAAAVRLPLRPKPPEVFEQPIEFPPDSATVPLNWGGGEWPDPLAGCPGYREPIGLPVTLEVGRFAETQLSAHSILANGGPIEHCAFDAPSYTNPDRFSQEYAREVLKGFSAVVLIPRDPLVPGKTYTVSVTARGRTYDWSFKVSADEPGIASDPSSE